MLKKIRKAWINFWGNRYRIYEKDREIYNVLIYHKRMYLTKVGERDEEISN